MYKLSFILLILFVLSCQQSIRSPKGATMFCDNFYAKGEITHSSYLFCSAVPIETPYTYKKGKWTFWDSDGTLVAEGAFKLEKKRIEGHGGCSYYIVEEEIDKHDWQFWDKEGKLTGADDLLIEKMKSCKITLIYN